MIAVGSLAFGIGSGWWALAIGTEANYVSDVLAGTLLGGIGVGLILPAMMATASASLAPHQFATGSAVINMIRQTGMVLGIAILVAVLGSAKAVFVDDVTRQVRAALSGPLRHLNPSIASTAGGPR